MPALIVVGEVVQLHSTLAVSTYNRLRGVWLLCGESGLRNGYGPKRLTHLRQLEAESIHIIREVAAEFSNPVMMYSIGKDSSVMLHLARKAFYPGTLPFPLLHVDTGWKFREMYEFRDRTAKAYGCELLVHKTPKGWRWALTRLFTAAPNTPTS